MSNFRHLICLMLVSAMLTACGSGGGSSASAEPDQIVTTPGLVDPSSNPDVDPPNTAAHAKLSWSPPAFREDGSALAEGEIARYEIYHIEDSSGDMDIIEVDANSTEYSVALAVGSHELGVAVVDINGVASQMSDVQTIEIN